MSPLVTVDFTTPLDFQSSKVSPYVSIYLWSTDFLLFSLRICFSSQRGKTLWAYKSTRPSPEGTVCDPKLGTFGIFEFFFNNKKWFFYIFYQVNNLFLRQSYFKSPLPIKLTDKKCKKSFFIIEKIKKFRKCPATVCLCSIRGRKKYISVEEQRPRV